MKKTWEITLQGLMGNVVLYNKILLYMYKNKYNGIALSNDGVLQFVKIEQKPIKKGKH